MNRDLGYGLVYVVAHPIWAWTFRRLVDPWLRMRVGRSRSIPVVWAPATTFPFAMWSWSRVDRRPDGRLEAYCAVECLLGAFLPVLGLAVLLDRAPCSARLAQVLYLMTMPMMTLFLVIQVRRSAPDERKGVQPRPRRSSSPEPSQR